MNGDERTRGVVVHLDEGDPDKHEAVLRNIANLLHEIPAGTPVELVVHGPGLRAALVGAPHAEPLAALLKAGVGVAACENSMRGQSVVQADLVPGVTTVPAGVAHLVQRQWQGWAYLRP